MSRYVEIIARQYPYNYGIDANHRNLFSCNFDVKGAAPMADLELEIVRIITTAGLGAFGTDLFVGKDIEFPEGVGPYTRVITTGGLGPLETHNNTKVDRPSFQIIVCATSYTAGRNRSQAIYQALDGQRNVVVSA